MYACVVVCGWMQGSCSYMFSFFSLCIIVLDKRHVIFSSTNHGYYFCSCVFFVFNVSSQFITCVNVQFALQYKSIGFDIEIAMWLRVWDDHDDDDEEELVFGH